MIRDEIIPYIDEDGLVLEKPNSSTGPDTGNGITNLCIYNVLLFLSQDLQLTDMVNFCNVIRSCEVEPGLYNRGPRKQGDLIAHDDYVALSACSSLTGRIFSHDIAEYGKDHFWNFNNAPPRKFTFKSWQGRFVYLVPFWKICGGFSASSWSILALSIYMFFLSSDESSVIQQWLIARAMQGRLGIVDYAIDAWKHKLIKKYPFGMKSVFEIYFGAQHPFAKYGPVF